MAWDTQTQIITSEGYPKFHLTAHHLFSIIIINLITILLTHMKYPKPTLKARYENFINGQWKAPVDAQYFEKLLSGRRR